MKTLLASSLSRAPLSPTIKGDERVVSIADFKGGCGGSGYGLPGGPGDIGILMTVTLPESTPKGNHPQAVSLPVFVALLDREDNVLDRQDETVKILVTDDHLIHTHKIVYHPPRGIDVSSENHRVLLGFNGDAR